MTFSIEAGWWMLPAVITIIIWAVAYTKTKEIGPSTGRDYGMTGVAHLFVWLIAAVPTLIMWLIYAVLT